MAAAADHLPAAGVARRAERAEIRRCHCPIGAFIGELVGGQQVGGAYGLGYIILRELKINARTDSMMVAVVFMIILALGLYALVSVIAARASAWSVTDLKPLES